ncbi:MAG: helix-turn-helix domain-containing protein [Clostridiales bacterium]|nr:helix-turn-helix domain-containing protein [Clostridiales bacterium]
MNPSKKVPTMSHPMLMTAKEMSKVCGIGENRLRRLMEEGHLEYLQVGSHRLICEQAIWAYYERAKTPAQILSQSSSTLSQTIGA